MAKKPDKSTAESRAIGKCIYCPEDERKTDKDKMSPHCLLLHTAVFHIDQKATPTEIYSCDGGGRTEPNAADDSLYMIPECSTQRPFRTLTATEYVKHVTEEHPDFEIPYHLRYKAAVSDFLTECSLMSTNPPVEDPAKLVTYAERVCKYVEYRTDSLPGENDDAPDDQIKEEIPERNDAGVVKNRTARSTDDSSTLSEETESTRTQSTKSAASDRTTPNRRNSSSQSSAATSASTSNSVAPKPTTPSASSSSAASASTSAVPKPATKPLSNFDQTMMDLRKRYKTNKSKKVVCAECKHSLTYSQSNQLSLIQHAQQHMTNCLFKCKLCDRQTSTEQTWRKHFDNLHSIQKAEVDAGKAAFADFYIDRSKELEDELGDAVVNCFLRGE